MTNLHLPHNQSADWIIRMVKHADPNTRIYYGQSYIKPNAFEYTPPPEKLMNCVYALREFGKVSVHHSRRQDGVDGFDYFCMVV